MALLALMAAVAWGILRLRNLFAVVILGGVYSFLMATVLVVLDAVDVAMTEASVGAGISTALMLATLYLTKTDEAAPVHTSLLPALVAIATGAALVYGTIDLAPFGVAEAPIHSDVSRRYIEQTLRETLVPNVVTSVLASYRGYDTLGETTVIFTAGIGVLLLLRGGRKRGAPKESGK
jgi:multicomponent Na+:H+ antiporter subunit B